MTPREAADPNLLFSHPLAIFFRHRVQPQPLQCDLSELFRGRIAAAAEWRSSVARLCLGRKKMEASIPTCWVGMGKTGAR